MRPRIRSTIAFGLAALAGACGSDRERAAEGEGGDADAASPGDGKGDGLADAGQDPSATPGTVRWVVPHRLAVDAAAAIAPDGALIVHGQSDGQPDTDDPNVLAIGSDGRLRWSAAVDDGAVPVPSASVVGDVAYVPATDLGASGGTLHAFALADGARGPTVALDGAVLDGLAIASDATIYAAARSLMAVGPRTWSFPLVGGVTGTNPAIGPGGQVHFAARGVTNHGLYAVSRDGAELWRRDLGVATIAPIAIDRAGAVYVVNSDGLLVVFTAAGELVWAYQLPSFTSGGGVALGADGTVYVGTLPSSPLEYAGQWLFAVRQGEGGAGVLRWRAAVGHGVRTTPALSAGGTLYVTDLCRALTALDAATGEVRWSFREPHTPDGECAAFSSPALATDGTVYVSTAGHGDDPGGTYALVGDGTGPAPSGWPVESGDPAHLGRVD